MKPRTPTPESQRAMRDGLRENITQVVTQMSNPLSLFLFLGICQAIDDSAFERVSRELDSTTSDAAQQNLREILAVFLLALGGRAAGFRKMNELAAREFLEGTVVPILEEHIRLELPK